MNISANKSFCALALSDRFIAKEDGSPFNLGYDNIQDIMNSESYKQIRKDMIQGNPIAGCDKCYNSELHGGKSYRQYYNRSWINNPEVSKKIKQTIQVEDIYTTVQYFDIRFGNLCNLSCRSCYSGASSQFDKDVRELAPKSDILKFHGWMDNDVNTWYTTETFQNNIASQIENIKLYYMNGGEPTIIEKNIEILKYMIQRGVSKNITLQFNSNMTNTRKDFYDLLPHFHKISFMASIDGYDKMQEYLRYPSKWSQITSNLNKLLDMKLPNLEIKVTPVISKYNLEYIVDLFDFIETINQNHNKGVIQILPIILMDPPYLDFEFLPSDYKIKCFGKIEKWVKESCRHQGPVFYSGIDVIKGKCMTVIDDPENLNKFFEYTDIFDSHRNQKLSSVNPTIDSIRHK